jgi:hypothetical protein
MLSLQEVVSVISNACKITKGEYNLTLAAFDNPFYHNNHNQSASHFETHPKSESPRNESYEGLSIGTEIEGHFHTRSAITLSEFFAPGVTLC